MTATIISPLEDVASRLSLLLKRASQLKETNSIEPPLPAAEFSGDLGLPTNDTSKRNHFSAVEIASKKYLQSQLAEIGPQGSDFGDIWNFLDIIQLLSDQDQCESVLLWYLIEDLLESQSIEGCRSMFDYLESRRERLIAKHFERKQLVILRSCNELVRRLSRAEDAVFCGRVFIFVFQCFPLGDHSSVNRRGDYNRENDTSFDQLPPKGQNADQDALMTDAPDSTVSAPPKEPDVGDPPSQDMDELYVTFWSLQKPFADPPSVWEPAALESFKRGFETILEKFKAMKHVLPTTKSDEKRGMKRKSENTVVDEFSNNFNPKYLTSRELFGLELNDLAFRRYILIQALIFLQFLLSFTDKARKKMDARTQSKTSFTLSEEDTKWAVDTKKTINNILRVGTEGLAFARAVDTVLSRDKNWVKWKEENCPFIKLPTSLPETFLGAAGSVETTWKSKRMRPNPIGSLDLKFLRDNEDDNGIESLLSAERFSVPEAELLVNDAKGIELDLDFADGEEKTSLEAAKTGKIWRTLRIASRTKLYKFEKLEDTGNFDILLDKQVDETQETANEEAQDTPLDGTIQTGNDISMTEQTSTVEEGPNALVQTS